VNTGPELGGGGRVDERAGDVGRQQVRRALQPAEFQAHRRGEAPRGQCLAQPRHVLKQHVPSSQDARQRHLNGFAHADDHGGDPLDDRSAEPRDLLYWQGFG
jgi:hypothetical protein